jgi:hypothetical protein
MWLKYNCQSKTGQLCVEWRHLTNCVHLAFIHDPSSILDDPLAIQVIHRILVNSCNGDKSSSFIENE